MRKSVGADEYISDEPILHERFLDLGGVWTNDIQQRFVVAEQ
jgi:hypothetical protein